MFLEGIPYLAVSKLSLFNGSYAWSSNLNHVVLNTMPNVIVDVDLIIWEVQLLSLTSVMLIQPVSHCSF
jgi:hypothetical protein